jgi:Tfp pilus assembly protein PilV
MHTFLGTRLAASRSRLRMSAAGRACARLSDRVTPGADPRGEHGFLLVEVMISALLVALIIVATLNGFDVATRLSSDQRHRNQAAVLAAQSQEQLRTNSASALNALESNPHQYIREIGGTQFTVTQEANPVAATGTTGCNATESTAQTTNIQIISIVTWKAQEKAKRPSVKQASVISPPTGSALEVDVTNKGTTGVAGVTATAKFKPINSGSYATSEGTTSSEGCVVLAGIQALEATVEIAKRANFVTPAGKLEWEPATVAIAPNLTKHYPVYYDEGGRIEAEFTYKGSTATFEGKKPASDTFVVSNTAMAAKPEYQVGSTVFGTYEIGNEEHYKAATSTYKTNQSYTAAGAKYITGDLFPFASNWTVYAGDCPKNAIGEVSTTAKRVVNPGTTTTVQVPLSYVTLNVYNGTQLAKGSLVTAGKYPVSIENPECAGEAAPNNSISATLVHTQNTLTGKLENPFQPFGAAELCVYGGKPGINGNEYEKEKTYTVTYSNKEAKGSTVNIYLGEPSTEERATKRAALEAAEAATQSAREASEKTTKTTRESTEKTAKTTRESTEATTKTTRETKEATERTKWKEEETSKKITKKQKEEKEATQKTARVKAEKEESEKKTKAETEEATKKTAAEKTEKTNRETAEKAEAKVESERITKEAAEVPSSKEDAIASKQSSC